MADTVQRKPKPGEDCLFCRISGTGVCWGISVYAYSLFKKTPLTKVGDRRFNMVLCAGFALLGFYRGFIY